MARRRISRPLVIHANRYRFQPGETVESGSIATRMQLWCRHGRGTVWVDDQAFPISQQTVLLLPWGRRRRYQAARRDPCDVCGVHLIPRHGPGEPRWGELAASAAPASDPARSDEPIAGDPWPQSLAAQADDPLIALGAVALAHFAGPAAPADAEAVGLLSALLWREWQRAIQRHEQAAGLSQPLARLRTAQLAALHTAMDLDTAARIAGCSPATLTRRCKVELKESPMAWLRGLRLVEARRQLIETGATADTIARACGFRDGDHLARCLRQAGHLSPRELRRRHGRGV